VSHNTPAGQPQRRYEHFKAIVLNLYALKNVGSIDHLADRMAEIDDISHELPRESMQNSRSIFTWLGSGIANVFGLSTIKI